MRARVKLVEGVSFLGESGSGHAVVMEGSPEIGGRELAVRPMEMLLLGLGGCSAIDVVTILRKGRQALEDCTVELEGERSSEHPKVFTRIHIKYRLKGRDLDRSKVERAIKLSAETYCSAAAMLAKTAEITHDFEIEETAPTSTLDASS